MTETVANKAKVRAYKLPLPSGKTVVLREPQIIDSELCAKEVGPINQDQLMYGGILFQKAMVKRLLVQVNDKTLSLTEKEQLDSLFDFKEYGIVQKAVAQLTDTNEGNELNLEITTI